MIRRALCICLSGMALISAASVAGAEPPPPSAAPNAASSAPAAPAPSSAPPAPPAMPSAAPSATPGNPSATPPPPASYPYAYGYPYGYSRQGPLAPPLELRAPTQRYWYGWQTLIVFAPSGLLMAAAPFTGGITGLPSLGGFLLGGPIVHWANGNVAKGFVSLGINVGATLAGGLTAGLMCLAACKSTGDDGLVLFAASALGGGAGLLIANVIDVAVLSYGERQVVYKDAAARRPSFTWLPTFDAGKGRASVGLMGTF